MIPVAQLLYKIDQRLNKLSSNQHQEIQLEDKILALNEAQISLIKSKMSGQVISSVRSATGNSSSSSRLGMDATKKRYEDIQTLIVDFGKNSLSLKESNSALNQWDADITKLKPKYMMYADSYILADKGRCKNHVIWINKDLVKHGDIQFFLNSEHYRPSFEYQETFNSISENVISIFTDGTFTPKKLHVMYVRYPKYIDQVGYINFEGKPSIKEDCELPDYLEDELLDITVENLAMFTENQVAASYAQMRSQQNE